MKKEEIQKKEAEIKKKNWAEELLSTARKNIKLWESGKVEKAYQEALHNAQRVEDPRLRELKISIIIAEQERNKKRYLYSKELVEATTAFLS